MSVKPWCEGLAASTSISARGSYSGRSIATSGSGERYALDRRCQAEPRGAPRPFQGALDFAGRRETNRGADRKSTRLNSSHSQISYAVFCLKKKKIINTSY